MAKLSSIYSRAALSTVASTGAYSDLSGLPTLGTAAATASTDYATAVQGTLADSAVQPGDNISELANDAQYLNATTLASTSVEIDCGDFTNPV